MQRLVGLSPRRRHSPFHHRFPLPCRLLPLRLHLLPHSLGQVSPPTEGSPKAPQGAQRCSVPLRPPGPRSQQADQACSPTSWLLGLGSRREAAPCLGRQQNEGRRRPAMAASARRIRSHRFHFSSSTDELPSRHSRAPRARARGARPKRAEQER